MPERPSFASDRRRNRRIDLSRRSDRAAVAALAVAALLALLIWSPRIGGAAPGDPSTIAADARLARCGGTVADVEWGFTIPRARDVARYVPALADSSELELERPALVVVYRGPFPGADPSASPSGSSAAAGPVTRNLCVYVGPAGQGEINYYAAVPIAGLRATPDGPILVRGPQT
jgi:hypothetical protein